MAPDELEFDISHMQVKHPEGPPQTATIRILVLAHPGINTCVLNRNTRTGDNRSVSNSGCVML